MSWFWSVLRAERLSSLGPSSHHSPGPGRPARRGWRPRAPGCCWCRWGWARRPPGLCWPPPTCPPQCSPGPPRVSTRHLGLRDSPQKYIHVQKSCVSLYLKRIKVTLHRLAAVGHVSQLVDVEPMKARGQTLNLSSDLHFASRAPRLNNRL